MTNVIAYYRVSTQRQGESGLGLDAQRSAVEAWCKLASMTIVAAYTEVESGKLADRPKLNQALLHAKRAKAKLVIAKLDRLARNVAFLSKLMESSVEFIAVDNPNANRLTIHILAAVAEDEARRISERTTAALAQAKLRGTLLGSARPGHWDGREDRRLAGQRKATANAAKSHRLQSMQANADLIPLMQSRRKNGESYAVIAIGMNDAGHRTSRGNLWTAAGIRLALNRVS